MIRFIYADQLSQYPVLADSMFRDRAAQFRDRLDWEVTVDENGWEVDQYDGLNPLYIIWENAEGRHGGSVRIMPTVGRIMTNEHFLDLTGGVQIRSPLIWECTRFCLAPDAPVGVAAALLAAGVELGLRFGLEQAVGVIYAKTVPLYRRIGSEPDIIGSRGEGRDRISVGLWPITEEARARIS
jgi:acyl homoserine lactone synthase